MDNYELVARQYRARLLKIGNGYGEEGTEAISTRQLLWKTEPELVAYNYADLTACCILLHNQYVQRN